MGAGANRLMMSTTIGSGFAAAFATAARHNLAQLYSVPSLSVSTVTSDLAGIRHALAATRRLLEMYRRQLSDEKARHRLQRLDRRLLDVDQQLQTITTGEE
jgi:hypothetical protein